MWICEAPSSTARRASAAYSSGVYGIAGHWSRLAIAPLILQEMITGSSNVLIPAASTTAEIRLHASHSASYGHHSMLPPGPLDALVLGHPQRLDHTRARLARVDYVVDHRVAGGDVD